MSRCRTTMRSTVTLLVLALLGAGSLLLPPSLGVARADPGGGARVPPPPPPPAWDPRKDKVIYVDENGDPIAPPTQTPPPSPAPGPEAVPAPAPTNPPVGERSAPRGTTPPAERLPPPPGMRPAPEPEPTAPPRTPTAATAPPAAPTDPWLEGAPAAEPLAPEPPAPDPPAPEPLAPEPPAPAVSPAPPAPVEPAAPKDPWLEGTPAPAPAAGSPDGGNPVPEPAAEAPVPPDPAPMGFGEPEGVDLADHVRKLLADPGNRARSGYPRRLIPRADPQIALIRGTKPVVLLFYDDASKASDLQAAAFLPVLQRFEGRVDVVPIDVKNDEGWTEAERKLVKTYYMETVPTTVVLGPDRRPLMLMFQRIDGATLEARLETATRR